MDEYAREAVEDGVIQCVHFVLFVEPAPYGPIDRQVAPAWTVSTRLRTWQKSPPHPFAS
ncbi:hypothetical protein [Burkholderia stabilis]|uniref:hypothetical protein n=1 Tax=Burkholderia stabilis TaxID=95485 RepID=UPI0013CEBF4B